MCCANNWNIVGNPVKIISTIYKMLQNNSFLRDKWMKKKNVIYKQMDSALIPPQSLLPWMVVCWIPQDILQIISLSNQNPYCELNILCALKLCKEVNWQYKYILDTFQQPREKLYENSQRTFFVSSEKTNNLNIDIIKISFR